jgi:UDP-glucose 4-epimerase
MRLRNKRVVVTGGAGFIGSHVVDELVARDNQVLVIDNFLTGRWENIAHLNGNGKSNGQVEVRQTDIRDLDEMTRLVAGADAVFHLAVADLRLSLNDPETVHDINATGTLRMCQASQSNGVARFVYVSSSEAYGSAAYVPMDEAHPLNPTTVYGASKAAGELYALSYWRAFGLPVVVVRPFNNYGPREPAEGYRAEVIPKFVLRTRAGLPPVIFGDGSQTRDLTWVGDCARGIVAAAECDELGGDSVNIARGREISIAELCNMVLAKLGREDLEPMYLEEGRPGDVRRHFADNSKARRLLGFTPSVDIEQGLELYIQWVGEHLNDLQKWIQQERIQNW